MRSLQMSISRCTTFSISPGLLINTWTPICMRCLLRLKSRNAILAFCTFFGMPCAERMWLSANPSTMCDSEADLP